VVADGAVDRGREHEEGAWGEAVAVVLHHAGEGDRRARAAVEGVEGVLLEGTADLDGAVAAEVEQDDASPSRSARRAPSRSDDEGGEVLVVDLGFSAYKVWTASVAEANGRPGRARGSPAARDHLPVGVVAVHGDVHAPAAGGDA
jgi:hypothetical protein